MQSLKAKATLYFGDLLLSYFYPCIYLKTITKQPLQKLHIIAIYFLKKILKVLSMSSHKAALSNFLVWQSMKY